MLEFFLLLLLVGALALVAAPWIRRRRGALGGGAGRPGGRGPNLAPGTLLVTGVSGGPDSNGSQTVTLTGVINGPTVSEHEIYTRMVMNVGQSPTVGQLIPVLYAPNNPDKWGFAPPDAPEVPEPKTELY